MIKRKRNFRTVLIPALMLLGIAFAFVVPSTNAADGEIEKRAEKIMRGVVVNEDGTITPRTSSIAREVPIRMRMKEEQLKQQQEETLKSAEDVVAKANMKEKAVEAVPAEVPQMMSWNDSEDTFVESFDEYTLGPEDRLKITVFGEPELTNDYRIGSDGKIAFPLIGDVRVEGLTLRQAEEVIKDKLKQGFLKKPSVSIELAESRPFYILGEVRRPGSYNYVAGMNVLQAVAISGGFTYRANRKDIEVLRGSAAPADPIELSPLDDVNPGDIIYIKERFF
ncbi:MAG: polysaccharide biosynthesis/export family protein [Pseudomonadota bacterium]